MWENLLTSLINAKHDLNLNWTEEAAAYTADQNQLTVQLWLIVFFLLHLRGHFWVPEDDRMTNISLMLF